MDCERIARDDVAQAYLVGTLSEDDRDAFEQHYFACDRCLDEVRTLEAVRDELPRSAVSEIAQPRRVSVWIPAGAIAASVLLAATAILWRSELSVTPPPAAAQRQEVTPPEPLPPPATTPREVSGPSLEQLARVEPAPYEPLTFRTVPDEATRRFQQGMESYRRADYPAAIVDLQAAAALEPDAAHVRFFLGVSLLLAGDAEGAGESLRATVALGDSPYLEEAHLYLARMFLRQSNPAAAEEQLNRAIALDGSHRDEARRLLDQIRRVQ
jgi:tetratricopeptide (TPR) repeat protein